MFVRYDYRCENAKCPSRSYKVERLVKKEKKNTQVCKTCHAILFRLAAAPRTTFRFNDKKLKA